MNLAETTCCQNASEPTPSETPRTVRPAFSTREEESGVRLEVALPGVLKEDLKLKVHEGLLTLEALRKDASPAIRYSLSVKLAERLDGERIQATLEDGVLKASVQLRDEAKPREIPIG